MTEALQGGVSTTSLGSGTGTNWLSVLPTALNLIGGVSKDSTTDNDTTTNTLGNLSTLAKALSNGYGNQNNTRAYNFQALPMPVNNAQLVSSAHPYYIRGLN